MFSPCMRLVISCLIAALLFEPSRGASAPAKAPTTAPGATGAPETAPAPIPLKAKSSAQSSESTAADLPIGNIKLPPGFEISVFTQSPLRGSARSLTKNAPKGEIEDEPIIVYVGTDTPAPNGVVHALVTYKNLTVVEKTCEIATGLDVPNGVTWHDEKLYVATATQVLRYDDIDEWVLEKCGQNHSNPTVLFDGLPRQDMRNKRYIGVSPEERLYVAVGSPENVGVCGGLRTGTAAMSPEAEAESGGATCAIISMDLDGKDVQNYATGIRNSVGFDWQPGTGTLVFGNLGRDSWDSPSSLASSDPNVQGSGDFPDDVLFVAPTPNINFGYPYCHRTGTGSPYLRDVGSGFGLADPAPTIMSRLATRAKIASDVSNVTMNQYCQATSPAPLQVLGPHVAALGVKFYSGEQFPEHFNGSIFVAERGSWDREQSIGYRIVNVKLSPEGAAISHTVFAEGWLQGLGTSNVSAWGRPVDLLTLPDGSLLVSDDRAKVVYRITYKEPKSATGAKIPKNAKAAAAMYSVANPQGVDNPAVDGPDAVPSRAAVPALYASASQMAPSSAP